MIEKKIKERAEYYRSLPKESLRIKLELVSPIVRPSNPIMLDALLTYAVSQEIFPYDPDRGQIEEELIDLPLPLEETNGEYPVWKASMGYGYGLVKEQKDFWVRRTHDEFSGYKASGIIWPAGVISDKPEKALGSETVIEEATGPAADMSRGGFKSYYESRDLVATQEFIFHAVGNKEEVTRLMCHIHSIGKKRSIGFGIVKRVIVEGIDTDYSLFDKEGRPARYLPLVDFHDQNIEGQIEPVRAKPAYWSTKDMTLCYAPAPFMHWIEDEPKKKLVEWDEFDEIDALEDEWDETD